MWSYLLFFLSFTGIYVILTLGLNIQWGLSGILNIGVAGFFAVGAYTSSILTSTAASGHLGGYGYPLIVGFLCATLMSGLCGAFIALVTVRLRTDYLAIATIGIAETLRLVSKNEDWLTGGVAGFTNIPQRFSGLVSSHNELLYAIFVLVSVFVCYLLLERLFKSPWGRVVRAIRMDESAANAMGKNVIRFRFQAFIIGSMIMGYAGALYAHLIGFISPTSFDPLFATFIIWVMLILGGAGNNKGAILGAVVVWILWSGTETLISNILPAQYVTQGASIRVLLIGVLLQVILFVRPQGLLPERYPPVPRDKP